MALRTLLRSAAAVTTALTVAACAGTGAGDPDRRVDLVAYSTPQSALAAIQTAFRTTSAGAGAAFTESYGGSGDQSRAVQGGQPADVVYFSLEPDVTRLVGEGLVAPDWDSGPTDGIVADSVVVLVVRPGNPLGIRDWPDLIRSGVEVVTPNPASSGGARWNVLAAWGQVLADGGSTAAAHRYLTALFQHAVALPSTARDALTSFTNGVGDVLLSYENEAILARRNGAEIDYLVPPRTMLIETPAAATVDAPPVARAFLRFLTTAPAQREFARAGYRPVLPGITVRVEGANDPARPFPRPERTLTIDDFGGWARADADFFDAGGILPEIQAATGRDR